MKENIHTLKTRDVKALDRMKSELEEIQSLSIETLNMTDEEKNRTFLIQDALSGNLNLELRKGTPCQYRAINRMTSAGGFYSPQMIIIMAAPKGFKTGTLINIAKGYVRDGYNVYYADAENGHNRIDIRFLQSLVECELRELISGEVDDVLQQVLDKYDKLGGKFRSDFYPAGTKTIHDVDKKLEKLWRLYNWKPDVIIWDYLDLYACSDKRIYEKRLKIQQNYFDAIALNAKWGCFAFTQSQVNKESVNKAIIDMTGFSEDFGKAANAHASFALCRDDVEKAAGIGRIIPVMQREGLPQHSMAACYVRIVEAKMILEEITHAVWETEYEKQKLKMKPKKNGRRTFRRKQLKGVKDE